MGAEPAMRHGYCPGGSAGWETAEQREGLRRIVGAAVEVSTWCLVSRQRVLAQPGGGRLEK